jgi:AraC-like DNA-binding protein
MQDLTNQCFDSREILGQAGEQLRCRLMEAADVPQMVSIVESFFTSLLDRATEARELHYLTSSLSTAGAAPRISDLLSDVGWSRRRLERRFAQQVGLPAKQFAKIQRFRRALQMKAAQPHCSWTDITHWADYYDQAHLGKDFSSLVEASPTAYFENITLYPELELFLSQFSPEV